MRISLSKIEIKNSYLHFFRLISSAHNSAMNSSIGYGLWLYAQESEWSGFDTGGRCAKRPHWQQYSASHSAHTRPLERSHTPHPINLWRRSAAGPELWRHRL